MAWINLPNDASRNSLIAAEVAAWIVETGVETVIVGQKGNPFEDPVSLPAILAESRTSEFNVGLRKIWDQFPHVRPFIGGGLSLIAAEAEASVYGLRISETDRGLGFWVGGGVYWTLNDHFNIGMELKSSWADVTLMGVEVNAGGGHFGLLAGYHW